MGVEVSAVVVEAAVLVVKPLPVSVTLTVVAVVAVVTVVAVEVVSTVIVVVAGAGVPVPLPSPDIPDASSSLVVGALAVVVVRRCRLARLYPCAVDGTPGPRARRMMHHGRPTSSMK